MNHKLFIFDIDDTIMRCSTTIKIRRVIDDKLLGEITSEELKDYHPIQDTYLDYTDFRSLSGMLDCKLLPAFDMLRELYMRGQRIAIITARADRDICHNWFAHYGIDIPIDMIFATNDTNISYRGSTTAERKQEAMKILFGMGYTEFDYYDDDTRNNDAVREICRQLNKKITIITI